MYFDHRYVQSVTPSTICLVIAESSASGPVLQCVLFSWIRRRVYLVSDSSTDLGIAAHLVGMSTKSATSSVHVSETPSTLCNHVTATDIFHDEVNGMTEQSQSKDTVLPEARDCEEWCTEFATNMTLSFMIFQSKVRNC